MVELWNSIPYNLSLSENVDILVSPEHSGHVKKYLECSGIVPEIIIQDLQKEIDGENIPDPTASEDSVLQGRPGKRKGN